MNAVRTSLKIVLAPNALKGSLTAREAADAMAEGVLRAEPRAHILRFPVADGGDGLLDILVGQAGLERKTARVSGPLGLAVTADWLLDKARGIAWIEMASAAGLVLLDRTGYDPMQATTRGVGELIRAALDEGVQQVMLGIGGSATNDGGTGLLSALGLGFRDQQGTLLPACGESLARMHTIDRSGQDTRLGQVRFTVLCDVQNPMTGPQGASRVYGPQKGATPEQVEQLETGMQHYADILEQTTGRDVRNLPGAGAAGGLGGGLVALLNAQLRAGAEVLLDQLNFDAALQGADLVLTAEGRLDRQSAYGKAPLAVARRALDRDVPCFMIAGSLGDGHEDLNNRFSACFSLSPGPVLLETAIAHAAGFLRDTTEQVIRCYLTGVEQAK